jgi:HAMP domain-containing protein
MFARRTAAFLQVVAVARCSFVYNLELAGRISVLVLLGID